MKADTKTEAAVMAVLNKFMSSYEKRDIQGLMNLLVPDDDVFMFGTGIDEKRIGRQEFKFQAERDWSQTEALTFKLSSYHISSAGPVAWIASEGIGQGMAGGQKFDFPMRMTAVLEQVGDEMYLAQTHISLPALGQAEGDSVPV